ncbi:SDR family NAD(P)-dependent oxidoreductase [Parvibaculum sp. MBR-TMA-1.3b-4.2]|jgi:uncharacterized oxidoreductase
MQADIDKNLVVITGASRGIGKALADLYSDEGCPIIAVARSFSGTPAPGAIRVEADLSTPEGIRQVVDAVAQEGRPVGTLINNAGIQNALDLSTGEIAGNSIDREIAINLTAPIQLTRGLMPFFRRPGATIVNVTSLLSRHPKTSAPVYSASKAGLASFTNALRRQLAPVGISVIEVVPPLVDTSMTEGRGKGKLSPEAMATEIRNGISVKTRIVAPALAGRALRFNRLFPGLMARILSKG